MAQSVNENFLFEIRNLKKEFNEKLQEKDLEIKRMKNDFEDEIQKTKDEFYDCLEKKNTEIQLLSHKLKDTDEKLDRKLAELTMQNLMTSQGSYTINIDHFKKHFEEAKNTNKMISSSDFLTEKGYLGRLDVFLNGSGSGRKNHLSVFFQSVKGPYDSMLKWPMPWKTLTFILLINNKEVARETGKSSNKGGKWREHFKQPNDEEAQCLGSPINFYEK